MIIYYVSQTFISGTEKDTIHINLTKEQIIEMVVTQ
jgi:hypothetical protein